MLLATGSGRMQGLAVSEAMCFSGGKRRGMYSSCCCRTGGQGKRPLWAVPPSLGQGRQTRWLGLRFCRDPDAQRLDGTKARHQDRAHRAWGLGTCGGVPRKVSPVGVGGNFVPRFYAQIYFYLFIESANILYIYIYLTFNFVLAYSR